MYFNFVTSEQYEFLTPKFFQTTVCIQEQQQCDMFAILLNNFMVTLKLKDLVLYITIIASYIISR